MRIRCKIGVSLGILSAVICMLLIAPVPIQAQARPHVFIEPEFVRVPMGAEVELSLQVSGGVDINAFEVILTYDPNQLAMINWRAGDYLRKLAVVKEVDDPGLLRVAATQLGQPLVSGDGELMLITFQSMAGGLSPIVFQEALFADDQGTKTYPERTDGLVEITLEPTFTPTAPHTLTPTAQPTPVVTFAPPPGNDPKVDQDVPLLPNPADSASDNTSGAEDPAAEGGLTESMAPENTSGEPAATGEGAEVDPAQVSLLPGSESGGDASESGAMPSGDPQRTNSFTLSSPDRKILEIALWSIASLGLLLLAVLSVVIVKRKNQREEDLLL